MIRPADIAFRAQLIVNEHRQLYDYWVKRFDGHRVPARSDIVPTDFPRLLASLTLIDVERPAPNSLRFRIRLAGTRLRDVYERETTGLYLDELESADNKNSWHDTCRIIVEEAKPAQGIMRGPRQPKSHLVQYWLRLPLRTQGDEVGMILGHDAFLASSPEHYGQHERLSASR